MGILSNTGLLASTIHPVQRFPQINNTVQLQTLVRPAPFILKPLAGLYNPYPATCSLLCNHPTPVLPVPVIKTRNGFQSALVNDNNEKTIDNNIQLIQIQNGGEVPEELFRKYTETDSRPMTPTPTIISGTTTGVNRRCLTPQPLQRPKLIVDLRRTHSQETLSWTVYSEQCRSEDSPKSSKCSTPRSVINKTKSNKNTAQKNQLSPPKSHRSQNASPRSKKESRKSPRSEEVENPTVQSPRPPDEQSNDSKLNTDDIKDDDDVPRRRGRRRKGRSRAGTALKTVDKDPETQVSSILLDLDSSCDETPNENGGNVSEEITISVPNLNIPRYSMEINDSFLDIDVIKILQRELTQEIIDAEFDTKKKIALEEAYRCLYGKNCLNSSKLDNDIKICNANMDLWLNLPRNYSVRNARFELPIDNDEFEKLTPLEYIQNYVTVTEKRKTLYNFIFNRYREHKDCVGRLMFGKNIITGLGEVMGKPLNTSQADYIKYLLNWDNNILYNFRTWSSICVLCERLFAHEYWPSNPMDKTGNEMERVDFETLPRKLLYLKIHPQLREILLKIRNT